MGNEDRGMYEPVTGIIKDFEKWGLFELKSIAEGYKRAIQRKKQMLAEVNRVIEQKSIALKAENKKVDTSPGVGKRFSEAVKKSGVDFKPVDEEKKDDENKLQDS